MDVVKCQAYISYDSKVTIYTILVIDTELQHFSVFEAMSIVLSIWCCESPFKSCYLGLLVNKMFCMVYVTEHNFTPSSEYHCSSLKFLYETLPSVIGHEERSIIEALKSKM